MSEQNSTVLPYQQDPSLVEPSIGEGLVELRNQAIEATLNPEGTLPHITLMDRYQRSPRQKQTSGIDSHNFAVFAEDGSEIARAAVTTPYGMRAERDPTATIDIVEIHPDKQEAYKGKGYGKAIYKEVLKALPANLELECDARGVSPDAIKIWQWLESRGLAERPSDLGDPVLSYDEYGKPRYKDLGYKTKLSELTDFAATKIAPES